MENFIKKIFDRDLRSSILNKVISSFITPFSSFIIVWSLTPERQGIYYVFVSLLGLKGFFDLGVMSILGQLTPHYTNKIGVLDDIFYKYTRKITTRITLIFIIVVIPLGVIYLSKNEETNNNFVLFCWIIAILTAASKNFTDLKISLLSGTGNIVEANKCLRESSILYAIVLWLSLFLGADLLSFSIATIVSVVYQHIIFKIKFKLKVSGESKILDFCKISQKVKKLVWRAGFTYISGYLVFQIQQPMIMSFLGAESSGKYGFCVSLSTILLSFSTFSISTKFPRYAAKIAHNDVFGAKDDFKRYMKLSIILIILALIGTGLAFWVFHYIPKFQSRLVDDEVMIIILLQVLVQVLCLACTHWPRAFQAEPFSVVAASQMVLTPILTYIGLNYFGLLGLVVGNLISWVVAFLIIKKIMSRFWKISEFVSE